MSESARTRTARPGTPRRFGQLYRANVLHQQRGGRFLILASFTLTFVSVRGITRAIHHDKLTFLFHNLSTGHGTHLHHLVLGILGLLGTGYAVNGFHPEHPRPRGALATLYGASAALTLDEFALWLNLEDVYWAPQGRESIDAVIISGALAMLGLEGRELWQALGRDVAWLLRRRERRGAIPPAATSNAS